MEAVKGLLYILTAGIACILFAKLGSSYGDKEAKIDALIGIAAFIIGALFGSVFLPW